MLGRFFAQDNLPDELLQQRSKAYAQTYLGAACREFAVGLTAEAQIDLSQAVNLEPEYLANGGENPLQHLCDNAERPLNQDGSAIMKHALENLPGEVAKLPRIKQRGMAKYAMARFFRAAVREDWVTMRCVLPTALVNDPKWLLNRGVWSLGATAFLGHPIANQARLLYR